MDELVKVLCEMMDTLSDSLTVQYYEESGTVWIVDTMTGDRVKMGEITAIIDRLKGRK